MSVVEVCKDTTPECVNLGIAICTSSAYGQWARDNCMAFCNFCEFFRLHQSLRPCSHPSLHLSVHSPIHKRLPFFFFSCVWHERTRAPTLTHRAVNHTRSCTLSTLGTLRTVMIFSSFLVSLSQRRGEGHIGIFNLRDRMSSEQHMNVKEIDFMN